MSKIFEALRKGQGEISEALPLVFEEEPQTQTQMAPLNTDESAVLAVLGDPEPDAPVQAAPTANRSNRAPEVSIRRLPIHLYGSAPLLPFDNTHFAASEQYRIIRTRLIQHPKQPRMVLISSAGPGDGKSVTAVNVAGALSLKTEANVLLADTDFRRSTIHTQLGLPASPGLADVLSGAATLEEALIRTEQFPNLYVISAGEPCANPSELLDSARWRAICDELLSRFRYVIADSPPVASVADYELLQATCDGVILVARPDHTKRQIFMKALETIPKDKLIGVVMNCVKDWFGGRRDYYMPSYYGRDGGLQSSR
jgi:protein-tyrosine kinase